MNVSLIVEIVTWVKSGITINVSVSVKIKKNIVCVSAKKKYVYNPDTCISKNGKNSGRIIGDSVIMCNEIIQKLFQKKPF